MSQDRQRPGNRRRAPSRPRSRPASGRPHPRQEVTRAEVSDSVRRELHRIWTEPMGRGGTSTRINLLVILLALVLVLFGVRLVEMQGLDPRAYASDAQNLVQRTQELPAVRGTITDRNGVVLAESSPAVDIEVDPEQTRDHAETIAAVFADHLGEDPQAFIEPLTRPDTRYALIRRQVPGHTYDRIRADLADAAASDNGTVQYEGGVYSSPNSIRHYPAGQVGANVVGTLSQDDDGVFRTGAAGFELAHNAELAGVDGVEIYQGSPAGTRIPLASNELRPAEDGVSYQLTLDSELQWAAEQALANAVQRADASSGYAVVMNVKSGEVLALANYPSFDPGDLTTANAEGMANRAVSMALEPGSTQKVLTAAALADAGYITPDTQVRVPAKLKSAELTITDSVAHDGMNLTASGVMAHSSNIGTVLMAREMPKAELAQYYRDFGLGSTTGIELPAETAGVLPGDDMPDFTRDQIAFGQGVSGNGVQHAAALAAVVNDGIYNSPTIVRSATDAQGNEVDLDRPEPRRVISSEASGMTIEMMEAVVGPGGTGEDMALAGYRSGGKTATAERYDEQLGRYHGYTASYVGFAPVEDPQILTYVVIDQPERGRYGGALAGPAYQQIMSYALPRYGVPPSAEDAPEYELEW